MTYETEKPFDALTWLRNVSLPDPYDEREVRYAKEHAAVAALIEQQSAEIARLRAANSKAAADVLAERRRQVEAEGWTPDHDDEHGAGEMARAAACYALSSAGCERLEQGLWPWGATWWKPKGARQDLVRAAALLLAEIERIDRAEALSALPGEKQS